MYHHAELVHWFKNPGKVILPASVDIDLTNICNQDCYYCNSAEFREEKPVQQKYTDYISLLDKLSTWRQHSPNSYGSLHTVTYPGGGEPTLLKGYEKIIEHTIDLGFLTSITTNGSKLDRLIDSVPVEKLRKMGWIGVDMDAGSEELYEKIRRSIPTNGLFDRVVDHIKQLTDMKVNVDLKILVGEYNHHESALRDIFSLAKKLNVRQIYFRPVLSKDGNVFPINQLVPMLDKLSNEYQVKIMYNLSKVNSRNYTRCHQMFQFPVFCADGYIYTCCENKGNPRFRMASWLENDFRDLWLGQRHMEIYDSVNTKLCAPCRSNDHNNRTQDILDNPEKLEILYF